MDIDKLYLRKIVIDALEEDIGDRDITVELTIPTDLKGKGRFIAKEDGVLAGFFMAKEVMNFLDPDAHVIQHIPDGESFKKGDVIGEIVGNFSGLLSGERTKIGRAHV